MTAVIIVNCNNKSDNNNNFIVLFKIKVILFRTIIAFFLCKKI